MKSLITFLALALVGCSTPRRGPDTRTIAASAERTVVAVKRATESNAKAKAASDEIGKSSAAISARLERLKVTAPTLLTNDDFVAVIEENSKLTSTNADLREALLKTDSSLVSAKVESETSKVEIGALQVAVDKQRSDLVIARQDAKDAIAGRDAWARRARKLMFIAAAVFVLWVYSVLGFLPIWYRIAAAAAVGALGFGALYAFL